jgi:hypothetical protein
MRSFLRVVLAFAVLTPARLHGQQTETPPPATQNDTSGGSGATSPKNQKATAIATNPNLDETMEAGESDEVHPAFSFSSNGGDFVVCALREQR